MYALAYKTGYALLTLSLIYEGSDLEVNQSHMQLRDLSGKFRSAFKMTPVRKASAGVLVGVMGTVGVGSYMPENTVTAKNVFADEVKTVEKKEAVSVEVLEAKLIDIVWNGESRKYTPENGEILKVFDPSKSMYGKCIQQFNRDLDCISWGPMQIKIGTVQHYWPQLYGVEITERDALEVALDLKKSQQFFVDCSVKLKGCAWNWTAAMNNKAQVQLYIDLIREAKGITM